MSDVTIVTVVTLILAAITSNVAAILAAVSAYQAKVAITENTALTSAVGQKADHIVELTNGSLSKLKAELASTQQEVRDLKAVIAAFVDRETRE